MDRAEVWKLEQDVMPPFMDLGVFHATDSQPHYSISSGGQFEPFFGLSVTSYDECYTPSRTDSFGNSDLEGLSSSRTSLASSGSNSPVDDSIFYSMATMKQMVKKETDDKSPPYVAPCPKSIQDHNMMNYDYSQLTDIYGCLELQDDFSGVPGMMFENQPGLLFHDTASPLPMTSSPDNIVVPHQTLISEPYRPTTPANMLGTVLGSPLDEYSESEETIKYFMSPCETHSQTPSSSLSSGSRSTLRRMPSSQTIESSVALHRIQSIGDSRISRYSKTSRKLRPKIDRVSSGIFRCDFPGCKSEHPFQRREHLKRHQRTHGAQKTLHCRFCTRSFPVDRRDNYRSHVERHSTNEKRSRTKFFPEAIDEVESWKKKKDQAEKNIGLPGERYRVYSRRGRAGGLFKSKL